MVPQIGFAPVGRVTLKTNAVEKKELTRNEEGWHFRQNKDHA